MSNTLVITDYSYIKIYQENFWYTMYNKIRKICDKCRKEFVNVLRNINNFRYCEKCAQELFNLGVKLVASKSSLGKCK